MDAKTLSQLDQLERYSFYWSEARLLIAAVALLRGGIPVLWMLLPGPSTIGLVSGILTLTWIISGLASAYLLYRWYQNKWMVLGGKDQKDMAAFAVCIISGINLGLAGLLGRNIGMTIAPIYLVWVLVALVYLVSSVYLFKRWKAAGEKLFSSAPVKK